MGFVEKERVRQEQNEKIEERQARDRGRQSGGQTGRYGR